MKDSDWLYEYYGNQKVIYSETNGTLNSMQFDINLRYNFFQEYAFLIGGMLGYSRTSWDWEARDGYQWSIDSGDYYQGPLEGLGITYQQDLDVPYIGAILSMFSANSLLGFNGYILYSPFARCQDEDDHVLRYKLSQGDTKGTYLGLGADLRWNFAPRWAANGALKYSSYKLEGDQTQYFYAGDLAGSGATDIDLTVEGSQIYFGLGVSYDF
jgi:outer membrane protease